MSNPAQRKWNQHYQVARHVAEAPTWLDEHIELIPTQGTALDLAAGQGRLSLWLAQRGLSVTATDISSVGLAQAEQRAQNAGLRIRTQVCDLERLELPAGTFSVISCFHYRQRSLSGAIDEHLMPGGIFVAEQATIRNLERNAHPSQRWLAEPRELREDYADFELRYWNEGWHDGQHLARMLVQKPEKPQKPQKPVTLES